MTPSRQSLTAIARLPHLAEVDEHRTAWRQAMATLGGAVLDQRPAPLEGIAPKDIQATVRVALEARFLDELDFLSPPARAACLYELGTALPPGPEKRELGRRALKILLEGDAPTFAMLATLLALGSSRALTGGAIQARVALCLDLPLGAGARADALALALISRRETVREWLTEPSMGSLPSRRLAARLLERAVREAGRRFAQGEYAAPRVFETPEVRSAWTRLLADREPLVWRHVAVARGLLSAANEDLGIEIHRHTDPSLSPTEWRRAATSLAASIAVDPEQGLKASQLFLRSTVFSKDPGIASAMALGLPRAAETEPSAVTELMRPLLAKGDVATFEALVDMRNEHITGAFGDEIVESACSRLMDMLQADTGLDDGKTALIEALWDEMSGSRTDGSRSLVQRIDEAVMRYATLGAQAAFEDAQGVLFLVRETLDRMEQRGDSDVAERKASFRALRELDMALLEKGTLGSLLALEGAKPDEGPSEGVHDAIARMSQWLFEREGPVLEGDGTIEHPTLRLQRMRMWLHVVDASSGERGADSDAGKEQRLESARLLLRRVHDDIESPLSRVTVAACSRACDALVRDEIFEVSDVLILAAAHGTTLKALQTFAEASVVPDIKWSLEGYAQVRRILDEAPQTDGGRDAVMKALQEFANTLPISSTPRLEAFRQTLLETMHALEGVRLARSLSSLRKDGATSALGQLEAAVAGLSRLVVGALRRLGQEPSHAEPMAPSAVRELDFAAERASRGLLEELDSALAELPGLLGEELPPHLASAIAFVLEHLRDLPAEEPSGARPTTVAPLPKAAPLPPWLPPGRTLGSFYVLRVLGTGAVGSVFVATRIEDRHKSDPQKFALKVPEYAGAAARELSEQEFHSVFRQEAGALLALPDHENLARLVTFDAGAKPKPILVMELVEGPSLERVIRMQDMTVDRAFELLDGVAAGLEVMHQAGIGHLDVKPSNVIMREPRVGSLDNPAGVPVLVDFGLAGRHVRPGCATGAYGAPEVWGALGRGAKLKPMPADVYAFGCLAYELLTGTTLFTGPSEIALVTAHISHDGNPPGVLALASRPEMAPLVELLTGALRHRPDDRLTITEVRQKLLELRVALDTVPWPVAA